MCFFIRRVVEHFLVDQSIATISSFPLTDKLVDVLQRYPEPKIGRRPYFSLCYRLKHVFFVFLVDCCDVHPYFGLKYLGVEEAHNWLINLVKRGTSHIDQEGLENPLMQTLKSTGR